MSNLPKDPVMLLSVINTKLRDTYSNLELLCQEEGVVVSELTAKLTAIDYVYDANSNQFK